MNFSALRDRALGAMRNYFDRGYDVSDMLDFQETPAIRNHLNEFYSALCYISMSSALGSFVSFTGVFGLLSAFIACWMFHAFHLVPPADKRRRVRLLIYCAFFLWASVTPWLTWLLGVDKGFVVSTILAAWAGFVSVGYWFGKHNDELVYAFWISQGASSLAAYISLYLTTLVFDGDSALWNTHQMCNVVTRFMMYVLAYSREVMVRARGGDDDYADHALHLYTHFPSFVVHLSRGIWNNS